VRLRMGLFFLAIPLAAQQAPLGLVHGTLLECEAHQGSGELSIRTAGDQVFRFIFDDKTYFEREQEHVAPSRLQKGDWVEIVSDKWPGSALRYARTVHVTDPSEPVHARRPLFHPHADLGSLDPLFPRGDLTFSGVVERLNAERLILHGRSGDDQVILLRQDTRYLSGGSQVDATALKPRTRVYIRAGKNLDNQVEAYQVVWGEILEPGSPR
jgi:hypothetical protein